MNSVIDELLTVRDWLRWTVTRFEEAELFFGHGTDNAWDEAIWLLLAILKLPRERLDFALDARLTHGERTHLLQVIQQRVDRRVPTAYLTREAWLGPYRFYVDERVIVPRSYFAELLEDGLVPWIDEPLDVTRGLDLCTGSGCLAILMANAFPNAAIDAIDLSAEALEVAARNVTDYHLGEQVELIESDLFAAVAGRRYDVIISNPPYVTSQAMDALPIEYKHEPSLALAAGDDGLDIVRRILAAAPQHLTPNGIIAIEVGHNRDLVEAAFPTLTCYWLDTEHAEGKIFLVRAEDL